MLLWYNVYKFTILCKEVSVLSLSITGNFFGQIKNSKQYQAAAKDFLELHRQEVAVMSPEQNMMYELLGGEKA